MKHAVLILLFVFAIRGPVRAGDPPDGLAAQLSAQLAGLPASAQVAVCVQDTSDGTIWFAHQADALLKPASTMKLFATAAALEHLGPDFSFKTCLYVRNGELWVLGSGDPAIGDYRLARKADGIVSTVFDKWAAALRTAGVDSLTKIVLDDNVFDAEFRHEDWPIEQAHRWYEAPVGGLNFNDNCLDTRAVIRDGAVSLVLTPDLPAQFFENEIRIGARHKPMVSRMPDSDIFRMSGSISRDDDLGPVSANSPTVFFGHALKQALDRRGIAVAGDVVRRKLEPEALASAKLIATFETPLRDVVWRANNFSQNLFAECLLKSLSAYQRGGHRCDSPGSWSEGTRLLRSTLESMGVGVETAVFRDGSGLSHKNRVTARQLVDLLRIMRRHRAAPIFLDSLATPGEDGTLRRRFTDSFLRDKVRAKTGTLAGVSALAGYVERSDGTTLAFSVLVNGGGDRARNIEDSVASTLVGRAPAVRNSRRSRPR